MAYQLEDEFGDIIGKARRGNGLSLNHVANEAGITDAQLSQMEAYTLKPTEDQVHKIAKALGLNGSKLVDIAMERWAPAPVPSELDEKLDVERISGDVGGYPVNAYLLICKATKQTAVIDTAAHPNLILERIREIGVEPAVILLTHAHADHSDGLPELEKATNCPTYIHANEPKPRSSQQFRTLNHGDEVSVGELTVTTLDTPGHTPGGCSFYTGSVAAVGDAIFAGSVGGPKISYEDEITSVRDHLLSLPDDVRLFPGHGPSTTVGEEKEHNPFF
ncbi:MAG: MBL fold metallo-hydrolase [Candidatus Poribacteria bacterium]|nr:MBL fold metallo-hydrolase [Candidatus Poribacteria bacterium]